MENIIRRKYKADMGNNFEDWANSYFSPDSEHLDSFIVREKAFADYKSFSGVNKITMQRFTKALKGFVALCPYIDDVICTSDLIKASLEKYKNFTKIITRRIMKNNHLF